MSLVKLVCTYCKNDFYRTNGHANETVRLGRNPYCSLSCLGKNHCKEKVGIVCENPQCKKEITRIPSEASVHNYCSHSCAIIVLNTILPRRAARVKTCLLCAKNFTGSAIKYCSTYCQSQAKTKPKDELLKLIKNFVKENDRIPMKREIGEYSAIRRRFGTWNNAIITAGFKPNPVIFAKKHFAKDGHKCDSLAERIIDDFLFRRGIAHERNIPYPGDRGFTVDFKVNEYWIEFFGLAGEHKRYDELKTLKIKLANEFKLKLISIYPEHLYPVGKLDEILKPGLFRIPISSV